MGGEDSKSGTLSGVTERAGRFGGESVLTESLGGFRDGRWIWCRGIADFADIGIVGRNTIVPRWDRLTTIAGADDAASMDAMLDGDYRSRT